METEAGRAERLGKQLGLDLDGEKFVLCHSALKVKLRHLDFANLERFSLKQHLWEVDLFS